MRCFPCFFLVLVAACLVLCIPILVKKTTLTLHQKVGKVVGGIQNENQFRSHKDPNAGRDWGQEKGTTEDEMAGWHHRLDGHEVEQTPGVGDGQGGLACCDSWGRKESDTTERLN